ncbi:hypothetical protein D3C72_1370610 [compost metagenome]
MLAWVFAFGYSLPARLDDRQVLLLEELFIPLLFLPLILLLLASLLCSGTPLSSTSARLGRFHLALGQGKLSIIAGIRQLIAPLAVLQLPLVTLVGHLLPILLVLPHGISQAHGPLHPLIFFLAALVSVHGVEPGQKAFCQS